MANNRRLAFYLFKKSVCNVLGKLCTMRANECHRNNNDRSAIIERTTHSTRHNSTKIKANAPRTIEPFNVKL